MCGCRLVVGVVCVGLWEGVDVGIGGRNFFHSVRQGEQRSLETTARTLASMCIAPILMSQDRPEGVGDRHVVRIRIEVRVGVVRAEKAFWQCDVMIFVFEIGAPTPRVALVQQAR